MKLLILFFLALNISFLLACKCATQSPKDAFCKADWVSHVRVKLRLTKQPLPAGAERKGLNNLRYAVEHIKTFKTPSNMSILSHDIYTPSEAPACGLTIEAGKEYLLAGRVEGGSNPFLFTVLCGQVLLDESSRKTFENVLEYQNVPEQMVKDIESFKC